MTFWCVRRRHNGRWTNRAWHKVLWVSVMPNHILDTTQDKVPQKIPQCFRLWHLLTLTLNAPRSTLHVDPILESCPGDNPDISWLCYKTSQTSSTYPAHCKVRAWIVVVNWYPLSHRPYPPVWQVTSAVFHKVVVSFPTLFHTWADAYKSRLHMKCIWLPSV